MSETQEALMRQKPPPAPKRRQPRLRKLLVVHHITPSSKLYAAMSKRFASDQEYICRFFDTQEDVEAYAASMDEPVAIFLAKPIAEKANVPPQADAAQESKP